MEQTNVEVEVATSAIDVMGIDNAQVIKRLLAEGGKRYNGIRVVNATPTVKEKYVRVGLTIDRALPSFIADESGEFVEGTHNVIFTSNFNIAGVMKQSDELAILANTISNEEKCGVIPHILCGSKIDVIQVRYEPGEEVKNPFSASDKEGAIYDHEILVNYIVHIELGRSGNIILNKIADQVAASFL